MSTRGIQTQLPQALGDDMPASDALDAPFPAHLQKYRQYIRHLDLSEAREREFLEALWAITNALVEHSFQSTQHPTAVNTQVASEHCKD